MLLPHCKNKDCHEDGTCAAEFYRFKLGEAKAYLWAQPSSYWIYKNTATNELDTQICTSFVFDSLKTKGTQDYSNHINVEYDRIRRTIQSSYNQWIYYDETDKPEPNGSSFNGNYRIIIDRNANGSINTPFFYPFNINAWSSNTQCKGIDTTLTIQGKTYANVVRFEISLDGLWENSPPYTGSKYYWAKDVGLIKRTALNKPDNWELIEYNIIK